MVMFMLTVLLPFLTTSVQIAASEFAIIFRYDHGKCLFFQI